MKTIYLTMVVLFAVSEAAYAQLNPIDPAKPIEKKMPNFKKEIDAPKVGKIRLDYVYDENNEPISQLSSFKIYVTCSGRPKEVLAENLRACEMLSWRYAKEERILYTESIFAVVDAGSVVHCTNRKEVEFDLGKFCEDRWKPKSKKKIKEK